MSCFISFREYTATPLEVGAQVILITDVASHCTIRWTETAPLTHKKTALIRGLPLKDDIRFCFVVYDDLEQDEPGDTLSHTFTFPDWVICQTRYFYFFGSVSGESCVSSSPFFHFHNKGLPPPYFLYTLAVGDETHIYYVYPPGTAHWLAVHDLRKNANSWGVNTRYYMRWERDLYRIDPLPPGTFDTVKLRCWGGQTYGYHQAKYALKMPGYDVWESGPFGWSASGSEPPRVGWVCVLTSNPITGLPWQQADFDTLQLGVTLCEIGSFGYIFINYIYIEIPAFNPS